MFLLSIGLSAQIVTPAALAADGFVDRFALPATKPDRSGFVNTTYTRERCTALIQNVTACPLDSYTSSEVLWCDYGAASSPTALPPTTPLALPEAVAPPKDTCTTPTSTSLGGWKVPAHYTSVLVEYTDSDGGKPTNLKATHQAGDSLTELNITRLTFNRANASAIKLDLTKDRGEDSVAKSTGGAVAEGLSAALRARAQVELTSFLVQSVFKRVCGAKDTTDTKLDVSHLLPKSCADLPSWQDTGRVDLDVLRADAMAFPRHLGEELLWVNRNGGLAKGTDDLGLTLAITGRVVEGVVAEEGVFTSLGAWARTCAAVLPREDREERLSFSAQPAASALYLGSLLAGSLDEIELTVRPNGSVEFTSPNASHYPVLAILKNLEDTPSLPDGMPAALQRPDGLPLASIEAVVKEIGARLAGAQNAQLTDGRDATVLALDSLSSFAALIAALVPPPTSDGAPTGGAADDWKNILSGASTALTGVANLIADARKGIDPAAIGDLLAFAASITPATDERTEPLRRALTLGSAALAATTADEAQAAFEAAMHPPGGYLAKRVRPGNKVAYWSLVDAHVGLGAARYVDGTSSDCWAAPTAALGPEVSFYTGWRAIPNIALQGIVFDLGNMGAVPFTDQPVESDLTLVDALAPGGALHFGIGRSPFTASLPVQYTLGSDPGLRVGAALTLDLVLFP